MRYLRHEKCGGPLGALIALLSCLIATQSVAITEYHIVEVDVTFAQSEITREPAIVGGALQFGTNDKSATIAALSRPISCPISYRHQMRDRLSPSFSIAGPWRIELLTLEDSSDILSALLADPRIESAVLPEAELAGELPASWFPGSSYDLFCMSQPQLHRAVLGESQLSNDLCDAPEMLADHDMDLPQAWEISRGDTSVVVAIIDTGFDLYHPGLGGIGPDFTVSDSLLYYNSGVWFRNWRELPGESIPDPLGLPGETGIDDDLDGHTDEDCWGNLPTDVTEADVSVGAWTSLGTYTIEDSAANWSPGSLVGQKITLVRPPVYETTESYEVITANTATTITTGGTEFLDYLVSRGLPGWATFGDSDRYPECTAYKIGDGVDSDWDLKTDDLGYIGCPNDDDENGYEDDFRGWDFFDGHRILSDSRVGCDKEDYTDQDNDPRSFYDHGTAVASQVASVLSNGRMMGIAPNVRILPLRAGAQYNCGTENYPSASLPVAAIEYAVNMGADIVSLSFRPRYMPWAAIGAAIDAGVIVVMSAGNAVEPVDPAVQPSNQVVFVGGLNSQDLRWNQSTPEDPYESNFGPWVDVAALAQGVTGAVWGVMPHIPDEGGPATPWLPAGEWHSYVYDPEDAYHSAGGWSGTSMAAPIVAGVAALVKSVYPQWSQDAIVNKIKMSTDSIYGDGLNDPEQTWLGSGRVNAYKALTFYGKVAALSDTTWAHNIWIGGDIQVGEGRSLTIAAGDTVRVAIDDLLLAGANPNEIEFVIDGELHVSGTPSAPVVFESFGGSHPRWLIDEAITISGETFTIGGLGCAQIASAAQSFLMPGVSSASQVFAIEVTPVAALDSVKVDLTGLGLLGTSIRLYDNGQGEDILASDGIYTSEPFAAMLAAGNGYSIVVTAYAAGGGCTRRSVAVEVPQVMAKFTDVSSQTGLNYEGNPYSAAGGKFIAPFGSDMIVTTSNAVSPLYIGDQVLPSGAPHFVGQGFSVPAIGVRGAAVADFDNDGDEDLFATHAQTPKLYRNDAGTFVDVTSAMGLATLAAGSAAACWGDFDNDGWLDLFVARCDLTGAEPPDVHSTWGAQQRLFRNTIGSGGGFVDVTTATGVGGASGSVAASWGDLNNDGDLDLIVLSLVDPPAHEAAMFVNQGDGTFVNEFMTRMYYVGTDIYYGSGVVWADMNNDEDVDLVVSCAGAGSRVFMNDGQGRFPNTLAVLLPPSIGGAGTCYSGLQVFDHNLDGWQDVLLLSNNQNSPSRLFVAKPVQGGVEYVENTHNAALAHTSKGVGSLAADFTSDGDMDLFIGRPVASGEFFYKTDDQAGANSLGQRYVKVRLVSPTNDNVNRQGIGAAVTVTAGSLMQTQLVDGGSGRGGQRDRLLTFGLGDYIGPVSATIRWPGGTVQSDVTLIASGAGASDFVNVVSDAAPVISNVSVATYVVPGTTFFDWVFSWDTDVACKAANDVLTIDQLNIANPCWPGWTTVTPSPGIPFVYEAKAGGGYRHKVLADHEECNLNCSFRYTVTSDSGLHSTTSPAKTKKVTFCPSGF